MPPKTQTRFPNKNQSHRVRPFQQPSGLSAAAPLKQSRTGRRVYRFTRGRYWRNLGLYFCFYSLLGHWLELLYCTLMRLFGIYDPQSLVWDDPFYPFLVYGVAAVLCALVLVPLKEQLVKRCSNKKAALAISFGASVLLCLLLELGMGLLLNQPNHLGEFPLWDNSGLPLNVLEQAWLINDLFLGALATLYVWCIYPQTENCLNRQPHRLVNVLSAVAVAGFLLLCLVKFS
ncbi:MAG: putative ABC transporter permease [Coriobacteriales bacterium]|jgi:uncharacterized membrane protein|nr:putative ABC transporter permease [Coriobacteriales bacterium]